MGERNYFIFCILEGLRKAKVKALNHFQLAAVHHRDLEPPVVFLQWFKDTSQKHTNARDTEEIILKVKILAQSALDICRELQKLVATAGKS
jgi:hypothetical protein